MAIVKKNSTDNTYTWDVNTEDNSDTWVPVLNRTTIQHRTISNNINNAVTGITRSGTTFTATRANGNTFTFSQQDNNTTYSALPGSTTTNGNHLIPCKYVTTLSEPSQINGDYRGFIQFGSIGGSLLTKWNAAGASNPGDYWGIFIAGTNSYKTMLVVSPRSTYLWLVRLWENKWADVAQK